jgi:hypothetical protein
MKKIVFAVIFVLVSSSVCFAQMDFIEFINNQEPVASWTAAKKLAFLSDMCSTGGYQEEIDDGSGTMIPNPETKKQFANRMIARQIVRWVNGWRKSVAEAEVIYETVELE